MKVTRRRIAELTLSAILAPALLALGTLVAHADELPGATYTGGAKDEFDRLDGRGTSGVRVDVIEWAGNLELHVYPKGSLVGLALEMDRENKDKPVMVVGYRFKSNPDNQLIRRNIVTVPLSDRFNVYSDSAVTDYDKVIITNHALRLAKVPLDPAPKYKYPKGHPLRPEETEMAEKEKAKEKPRSPASSAGGQENETLSKEGEEPSEGIIKHFSW